MFELLLARGRSREGVGLEVWVLGWLVAAAVA